MSGFSFPNAEDDLKMAVSKCEAHRGFIDAQLRLGRNATAIFQDLVDLHNFDGAYNSVKRFVAQLRHKEPEQFDRLWRGQDHHCPEHCTSSGAPIARPELKRLRDSYFAKVAGPAGLKRDSAKVRGIVKQWAVAAVLRECEAMGLRHAIGPLWAVLVAAIERDPTAAMLALQIDMNSIRPAAIPATQQLHAKAIGHAGSPIGLEASEPETQALSCVGLRQPTTISEATQAIGTPPARMSVAQAAQQRAIDRHTPKSSTRPAAPAVRVGDDGVTRESDEYAHDLSAWE